MPTRGRDHFSRRLAARLERELTRRNVLRRNEVEVGAIHSAGKIGGFGGNEVTLAVIQENRHEMRIERRSDDKIGEFVSVHVPRRYLQAARRGDNADSRFGSGTEVKVDRILRSGRAIARYADHYQIGFPVAVKIRDGKLCGAKRDGRADEARDGAIRGSNLRVPYPEGCNQAEDGNSRK